MVRLQLVRPLVCAHVLALLCLVATQLDAQAIVPVAKDGIVTVDASRARVEVEGWNRAELSVEDRGDVEARPTPSGAMVRSIRSGDAPLRLRVPASARLVIRGTSGNVSVRNISGDVDVNVRTGDVSISGVSGRVHINGISCDVVLRDATGGLRMVTVSGDLDATALQGPVEINTTSGDIDIRDGRATSLRIETLNGEVSYHGVLPARQISRISTHNGDVGIHLDPGANLLIQLSTFSGKVSAQTPLQLLPSNPDEPKGMRRLQLGDGGGPTVAISTFNGNIVISHARNP